MGSFVLKNFSNLDLHLNNISV